MAKLSTVFLGKVFSKQGTNIILLPEGVYSFFIEKVVSGLALISIEKQNGKKKSFYQDLSACTVFSENEVLHLLTLGEKGWLGALKARKLPRHQAFSLHLFLTKLASSYKECAEILRV